MTEIRMPEIPSYWFDVESVPGAEKLTALAIGMIRGGLESMVETTLEQCVAEIDKVMRGAATEAVRNALNNPGMTKRG